MIELFNVLKERRPARLQIRCVNLSFFRCDSPTELIEYLEKHIDYYTVEKFEVVHSNKHLDTIGVSVSYISSFDIDIFISKEDYEQIDKQFHRSISKYDINPIDINKYKVKL